LPPLPLDPKISPRAAAEEIGYTFLPSVLVGLSRAPQFVTPLRPQTETTSRQIWRDDLNAVIVPATACGSSALLALSQTPTQIITVAENTTTLNVTAAQLGLKTLAVQTYLEAIGVVAALKAGVDPIVLRPDFLPLAALD
jgi:hypothetical protein